MIKALELTAWAIAALGIAILAAMLHYQAGYAVHDVTIWAIASVIGILGFVSFAGAALYSFGVER